MTKSQLEKFIDFAECLQGNIQWSKGGRCEVSLTIGDIKLIKKAADYLEHMAKDKEEPQ